MLQKAELSGEADSENCSRRLLRDIIYYIGLAVYNCGTSMVVAESEITYQLSVCVKILITWLFPVRR